jgi:signal transduction histidine kinase
VAITLAGDAGTLQLTVRDQGIGIAAEDHERIFGRFERGVRGPRQGGFGLGLWVVRQLVGSMGGDIGVESDLGRGATFTVTLPRGAEDGQ